MGGDMENKGTTQGIPCIMPFVGVIAGAVRFLQVALFKEGVRPVDKQGGPHQYNAYGIPMYAIILGDFLAHLAGGCSYGRKPRPGLFDKVAHGIERKKLGYGSGGSIVGLPADKQVEQSFEDLPEDQEPQRKGGAFYKDTQEETEREKAHKLYKIGQEVFEIGKYDGDFVKIGINKPQDHGYYKDKHRRYGGKAEHGEEFGIDKLPFAQSVDQVLLNGLVAVLVGGHRHDNNGQEQF